MQNFTKYSRLVVAALNLLFLGYLVIIASADPSPQLIAGVLLETFFFTAMTGYRWYRTKTPQTKTVNEALAAIEQHHKSIYVVRRTIALITGAVASVACIYGGADLTALALARCDRADLSKTIYAVLLPYPSANVHPGFTMELLAGAYIESSNFQRAESLELNILQLRRQLAGEGSELTATMYCNLADMYRKFGRAQEARAYYVRSIGLTKSIHLRQGWGSPATKLAVLLRDEHLYKESEAAFKDALQVRTRIFGRHSTKVRETLIEYKQLLQAEHRTSELADVQAQVNAIAVSKAQTSDGNGISMLLGLVVSLLFFSQRDRLLILLAKNARARAGTDHKNHQNDSTHLLALAGLIEASYVASESQRLAA